MMPKFANGLGRFIVPLDTLDGTESAFDLDIGSPGAAKLWRLAKR